MSGILTYRWSPGGMLRSPRGGWVLESDVNARVAALERENEKLARDVEDYQRSFDLRWKADMRAIELWRAESPVERDLVWPDHADLVVWLMGRLEAQGKREMRGWIGVDLDGTLAEYDGWRGPDRIGAPVPAMVERVKLWLGEGKDVRIFTARISSDGTIERVMDAERARAAIQQWCIEHLGRVLPITNTKDYGMIELWDDRCVQVEKNTGRRMDEHPSGEATP